MSITSHDPTVVGHLDDLTDGGLRMVRVDGHRLCLVRLGDDVFALDNACPHEGYGLTQGELSDDGLLTCAWHNWKFRVSDGACVLGEENVRTHDVTVADDGTLTVRINRPDPAEVRVAVTASLRRGIANHYVGQISRDVVRALRADVNPGELVWEAIAHGAPRAEFGWGHSVASATDCLAMVDGHAGDDRALPVVQAIAGIAEVSRDRQVQFLPTPDPAGATDAGRARFRAQVEAEDTDAAQATVLGALATDAGPDELRPWFSDVVSDHHLSYGHAAIYTQKAFQLLDRIGWDRAQTVLPHLVPTIVYGTREDKLPYVRPFLRELANVDLQKLASVEPAAGWTDDGTLRTALLGDDRRAPVAAAATALAAGAGVNGVLDVVVDAVSERMLRYDTAGERDFHDDFGWLDITHGLTYANATRWHHTHAGETTADLVRLAFWVVFQANWTGRHEWHTSVGDPQPVEPLSDDLATYGRALQDLALTDGTTAFIVHAHAVKMSVAATEEALRTGSPRPLAATHRFMEAPKLERFVAANVTRAIDFISGHVQR